MFLTFRNVTTLKNVEIPFKKMFLKVQNYHVLNGRSDPW